MSSAKQIIEDFIQSKTGRPFDASGLVSFYTDAVQRFLDRGYKPVMTGTPSIQQRTAALEIINRYAESTHDVSARQYGYARGISEGTYVLNETEDYITECVARLVMNPGAVSDVEFKWHQLQALHRVGKYDEAIAQFGVLLAGAGGVTQGPSLADFKERAIAAIQGLN